MVDFFFKLVKYVGITLLLLLFVAGLLVMARVYIVPAIIMFVVYMFSSND